MKQVCRNHLYIATYVTSLVALFLCQVQGGIITSQQSLVLPKELADSIISASSSVTDTSSKNGTRTGRVIYTASYSNVRISSKEPKSLKYFPIPAVISKKHVPTPTVIVPVLRTSPITEEPSTTTTTTTSTSTTTTTTTPPPETSSTTTVPTVPVEQAIPEIIEILEEIQPDDDEEELVTETVNITGGMESTDKDDNANAPVTEQMMEDE